MSKQYPSRTAIVDGETDCLYMWYPSGAILVSRDAGDSWERASVNLPRISALYAVSGCCQPERLWTHVRCLR
jgi:photosystem II stability/assembly factor-like uncharacterized protein